MAANKAGAPGIRRPPTNAKLVQFLGVLKAGGEDLAAYDTAHDGVRKFYYRGLPRGLDPAVVARTIEAVMPVGYHIQRLVRVAGTEYDEAIVEGVRRHRATIGVDHVLQVTLVTVLAEHGRVSIAEAYARLARAEEAVGRDPSTNTPADRNPAVLDEVAAAMDPWFASKVATHTVALAAEGMPPTAGSNAEQSWVTPPQTDEEWALFIGCALHPSKAAAAVLEARAPLVPRLDEPAHTAVLDVLRHARERHGKRVPLPDL